MVYKDGVEITFSSESKYEELWSNLKDLLKDVYTKEYEALLLSKEDEVSQKYTYGTKTFLHVIDLMDKLVGVMPGHILHRVVLALAEKRGIASHDPRHWPWVTSYFPIKNPF